MTLALTTPKLSFRLPYALPCELRDAVSFFVERGLRP
jgi:hypothetical protein